MFSQKSRRVGVVVLDGAHAHAPSLRPPAGRVAGVQIAGDELGVMSSHERQVVHGCGEAVLCPRVGHVTQMRGQVRAPVGARQCEGGLQVAAGGQDGRPVPRRAPQPDRQRRVAA